MARLKVAIADEGSDIVAQMGPQPEFTLPGHYGASTCSRSGTTAIRRGLRPLPGRRPGVRRRRRQPAMATADLKAVVDDIDALLRATRLTTTSAASRECVQGDDRLAAGAAHGPEWITDDNDTLAFPSRCALGAAGHRANWMRPLAPRPAH